MAIERPYYSQRTGKNADGARLDLSTVKRLFSALYEHLATEGYFQQDLGFHCVDSGFQPGELGTDLETEFLLTVRKDKVWPIHDWIVIEFLHDHVSKPTERHYCDWNGCGWHCRAFDLAAGRSEYGSKINRLLSAYDTGFELTEDGQVLAVPEDGMTPLLEAPAPPADPENVNARVAAAVAKFRRHRSSFEDRRDAIRDLADVLEFLRPKLKVVLISQDEKDLFNLANNFGIRHHNEVQKVSFDKAVWYSWMFYYYLATIHATTRLIASAADASQQ